MARRSLVEDGRRAVKSRRGGSAIKLSTPRATCAEDEEDAAASAAARTLHQAFVQAFAVPTGLYRFLSGAQRQHPLFLQRTLSYVRRAVGSLTARDTTVKRLQSSKSKRRISVVADQLTARLRKRGSAATSAENGGSLSGAATAVQSAATGGKLNAGLPHNASLRIQLLGFHDSVKETEWRTEEATVELCVMHHWQDRRKGRSGSYCRSCSTEPLSLRCYPAWGPSPPPPNFSHESTEQDITNAYGDGSVSLLYKELREPSRSGRTVHSYLLLRVRGQERRVYSKVYDSPPGAGGSNSRRAQKKRELFPVVYTAVLPLFGQDARPLLLDGHYEVRVCVEEPQQQQQQQSLPSALDLEWLNVGLLTDSKELMEYSRWPQLRFRVAWQGCQIPDELPTSPIAAMDTNNTTTHLPDCSTVAPKSGSLCSNHRSTSTSFTVTYRFMFAGQLQQWSEAPDCVCPWCLLNILLPGALLLHLRACHGRFCFRAHQHRDQPNHLTLEVSLNEDYDGSYEGRPDAPYGNCGLRRSGPPHRRLSFTHLVHWRGIPAADWRLSEQKQFTNDLTVALPTEGSTAAATSTTNNAGVAGGVSALSPRPLAVGHNRQYFHTTSSLPLMPDEFDDDSEAELDPEWLRQKYTR